MRRRYFVFHEGVAEVTLFAHWTAVNELNAAFLDDLGRFTTDEERLTYLKAFSTERRKTPSGYRRTRQKRRLMVRKTSDMINMIDRGEMS
ncbi:MAG: hypothetical protein HYX66_08830 [Ignavibacteria bacterium]|nr:hypothetical protein [Ignavibacteria bacterium]